MLTGGARRRWYVAAAFGVIMAAALTAPVAAADATAILLLHSYGYDAPGRMPIDAAFARAVRETAGPNVELYIETIDPNRFRGDEQARLVRAYLRDRYAEKRIAVVAAVFERALAFVLDPRDPLFPGVPVVAMLGGQPQALPDHVSVIWSGATFGDSATLALTLSPRARQIALIDAATPSPSSDAVYEDARAQVRTAVPNAAVIALHNLPLDELLGRVASLPAATPIVVVRQVIGRGGRAISTADAIGEIARVAPGPIYACTDQQIGSGAVGGIVISGESEAVRLAGLAVRIAGNPSLRLPPDRSVPVAMFDWRALRRWQIDEGLLPPGSVVRFREPSGWELYRGYILAGTFVLVLQSGLIAGLVVQRGRRRRIEIALRESEAALRRSADRNQDLAGRLIAAQEAERTRIARDLHDDVGQQLAGVGIMLSGLKRLLTRADRREADVAVTTLQERTNSLAETLRHLSHDLHPGVLRNVGLVAAIRQHAADVQAHYGITVTVDAPDRVDDLDPDVALCLYRVIQEALSNITRHAHATIAEVTLVELDGVMQLRVADDGVGFVATERSGSGLGLRSIDERVRLTGGRVQVATRPGLGTELTVRIPLAPPPLDVVRQA